MSYITYYKKWRNVADLIVVDNNTTTIHIEMCSRLMATHYLERITKFPLATNDAPVNVKP